VGIETIELSTGNWSNAPHADLDNLLGSAAARRELTEKIESRGLVLESFNCSGNPVHPGEEGPQHDAVTRKTIELAAEMGIERIVMMSGCPGAPGDKYPNWITVAWPPYTKDILDYQWNDVLIPYWTDLVKFAGDHNVNQLALEMHGHQNVYSPATLMRLRDEHDHMREYYLKVAEYSLRNYSRSTYMRSITAAADRLLAFRELHPGLEERISQKALASFLGITPQYMSTLLRRAHSRGE